MQALHVFVAGVAVALLFAGCSGCEDIDVPARPVNSRVDVLTPTEIQLQAGDVITITAKGEWDDGLGSVGPDGGSGSCAGCPVNAPRGALIGRIGEQGTPFVVGAHATIRATASGTLFLGINDNAEGQCAGPVGSCYDDNQGSLCVHVQRVGT